TSVAIAWASVAVSVSQRPEVVGVGIMASAQWKSVAWKPRPLASLSSCCHGRLWTPAKPHPCLCAMLLEELLCLAIPGEDIAPKKRRNLIRQVRKPHSRLLLSPEC
ncbi:MAG: hypothetical protein ACKN81_15360, partial [Pirellulaceae bacterium]